MLMSLFRHFIQLGIYSVMQKKNVTVTLNSCHIASNSVIFIKFISVEREFY